MPSGSVSAAAGHDYQSRTYSAAPVTGTPFDLDITLEQARTNGFGIVDGLLAHDGEPPQLVLPHAGPLEERVGVLDPAQQAGFIIHPPEYAH